MNMEFDDSGNEFLHGKEEHWAIFLWNMRVAEERDHVCNATESHWDWRINPTSFMLL